MTDYTGDAGNNTITGSSGDDRIQGLEGNDILDGAGGNDILIGGPGADVLTGGTGADTFRGTASEMNGDRITDFLIGDRIQFLDLGLADARNIQSQGNSLLFPGGSLQIDNVGPGRLVLRGITGGGLEVRLQSPSHNDFNGDGYSDILWRSDNGTVTNWLGQSNGGLTGNGANLNINISSNWHIAGTGDFDGDGRNDILWRADDGTVTNWLGQANGGLAGNGANLNVNISSNWQIAGTGDFNGDGRADVLWRATDGTVTNWLGQANGGLAGNGANFSVNISSDWHIAGTGDFNGDGMTDILWRADNGTVTNWLGQPNGGFVGNGANFSTNISSNWHIASVGDFNGDGLSDILWRADDGTITNWLGKADGSFSGNGAKFSTNISSDWHVVSVGDFNGDAIDDIAWQNNNGTFTEWLGTADGSFIGNGGTVSVVMSADWHVQDPDLHGIF